MILYIEYFQLIPHTSFHFDTLMCPGKVHVSILTTDTYTRFFLCLKLTPTSFHTECLGYTFEIDISVLAFAIPALQKRG
jgi:hypothetical protein